MAAAFYAPVPQTEGQETKNTPKAFPYRRRALWIMIIAAILGSVMLTGLLQANHPSKSEDSDDDSLESNHRVWASENEPGKEAFGDSLDEVAVDVKSKPIVEDIDYEHKDDLKSNNDDQDGDDNEEEQDNNPDEESEHVYEEEEEDQAASLQTNVSMPGAACTYWSESFRKKYSDTCGYWIDVYNKWERKVDPRSMRQVAYFCSGSSLCHGWGDRVAGMQASFHKALDDGVAFRIGHDYLSSLFNPCVFGSKRRVTNWAKNRYRKPSGSCEVSRHVSCSTFLGTHCTQSPVVNYNSDRMCIAKSHCERMLHQTATLSAAQVVGCGLRAMLEPSKELFEDIKFPIRIDGQTLSLNLKSIEETFSKYYVISIQMRLGDAIAFFSQSESNIFRSQKRMLSFPFRCAETVESHLRKKQASKEEYEDAPEETIHGKPVRYFLATDTIGYRQMAQEMLGDKLITFDFKPEHIAFGGTAKFALAKEIAEWYTLGLGQQLVLNKVGLPNDFYKGRFSGFAKSAWVYHLKHMVYDAGTCKQFSLPFAGTWGDAEAKGCGKSLLMSGRTPFGNEHLVPIWNQNQTFPKYYVLNGVVTKNGKIEDKI